MSFDQVNEALRRLDLWRAADAELTRVQSTEAVRKRHFIEAARSANWSWTRIGVSLNQTATAARRWYDRRVVGEA